MSLFICPVCGKPLEQQEKSYCCPNRHNFDRAKSGYVNLLPIKGKHSKVPGDNKLMVAARQEFLNEGYYLPLCEQLREMVMAHLLKDSGEIAVLDAGCGEGYYTSHLHLSLKQAGISTQVTSPNLRWTRLPRRIGTSLTRWGVFSICRWEIAAAICC